MGLVKTKEGLKVKEPSEIDKAYLAGLVDGEGSFYIDKRAKAWKFGIGMSDRLAIDKFKESFGLDNVSVSSREDNRSHKNSLMYSIKLAKQQTKQVAKYLYPYFTTKQDIALKVLLELVD